MNNDFVHLFTVHSSRVPPGFALPGKLCVTKTLFTESCGIVCFALRRLTAPSPSGGFAAISPALRGRLPPARVFLKPFLRFDDH